MLKSALRSAIGYMQLPAAARAAARRDRNGPPARDPGPEAAIAAIGRWLGRAQDCSASADGGVARDYSVIDGWATSYPETTGYIVPTMLRLAAHLDDSSYEARARRMLDWLIAIQLDDGGFQGGRIDQTPVVPVTFNTGQILIGLAAGAAHFGDGPCMAAMHGAARFLRDSLDDDGCWRSHPTPFAKPGEKAYETHVAWGLFEAERVAPGEGYGAAGLRQVDWALTKQTDNGWVASCCLGIPHQPLTHTLGYFLKGVVEAHRLSGDDRYRDAAVRTASGLMSAVRADGALPGRLNADWTAAVPWSCLTGNVQIADSWFYLFELTGETAYRDAALAANAYVRRTIDLDGPADTAGGVRGAFPIDGDYGRFQYLNWAAKFAVDSFLSELALNR